MLSGAKDYRRAPIGKPQTGYPRRSRRIGSRSCHVSDLGGGLELRKIFKSSHVRPIDAFPARVVHAKFQLRSSDRLERCEFCVAVSQVGGRSVQDVGVPPIRAVVRKGRS